MSSDKQKSLAAMRTFARDVEREQGTNEGKENTVPKAQEKIEPKDKKDNEKKVSKPEERKNKQPKNIPPFHEINKKDNEVIKTNIKAEPKKEKPKDKKRIEPTKRVGGGTVITDNKKPKRSFFTNAQKSIVGWFSDIKKSLQPKQKNTYVVTKTERRKGVVQKATSKTGTIFSADSETVKEQIKARQRAEKREHEDDINWSPYTETGFPLLEGDVVESTDPRIDKISVTPKTHSIPKSVIKQTEKIPELQEKVEVPDVEPLIKQAIEAETEAKAIEEEPAIETEAEERVAQTENEPLEISNTEEETIEIEDEEESSDETWDIKNASLQDTNTVAMLLVGIVLAIGIFWFVLFGIFELGNNTDSNKDNEITKNLYPGTEVVKQIILTERSANELVSKANLALLENQNENSEYVFVNENMNMVANSMVMDLMRTYKDDNFADVVTNIRYIETADEKRALIIEAPAESIALGSMLNWEPTLFVDMGALLDVPNVPLTAGEFVDTQVGNLDVRALVFDNETLLLYSIVQGTNIIITDDIGTLNAFMEL